MLVEIAEIRISVWPCSAGVKVEVQVPKNLVLPAVEMISDLEIQLWVPSRGAGSLVGLLDGARVTSNGDPESMDIMYA